MYVVFFVLIVVAAVAGGAYLSYRRKVAQILNSGPGVATVLAISQTGTVVNTRPQMRMTLEIEGARPRRVELVQVVDLGNIPRVGDRVYVLVDGRDPNRVSLAPSNFANWLSAEPGSQPSGLSPAEDAKITMDIVALPPGVREHPTLGIAKVVSATNGADGARLELDIDAIGKPMRRVAFTQLLHEALPTVGSRVYVLSDANNPDALSLATSAFTGGQKLPDGGNRLDPLVLGPQLLKDGAKADGEVMSSTAMTLGSAMGQSMAAQGVTKWELQINVTPQDGSARYVGTLTIALTSKEKVDRMARVGARVPLRYDPLQPQTFSIDSIAMGYPDPYESVRKLAGAS